MRLTKPRADAGEWVLFALLGQRRGVIHGVCVPRLV